MSSGIEALVTDDSEMAYMLDKEPHGPVCYLVWPKRTDQPFLDPKHPSDLLRQGKYKPRWLLKDYAINAYTNLFREDSDRLRIQCEGDASPDNRDAFTVGYAHPIAASLDSSIRFVQRDFLNGAFHEKKQSRDRNSASHYGSSAGS